MKRIGLLGGMSWESSPSTTGAGHCGAAGRPTPWSRTSSVGWSAPTGWSWCAMRRTGAWSGASVIYQELCLGIVKEDSRQAYRRVIGDLVDRGREHPARLHRDRPADRSPRRTTVPVFDTTRLHGHPPAARRAGR